jgi:thioredoxin 1
MKVIKLYAEWCGPCRDLSKVLEGMNELPPIENVDIDVDIKAAVRYNIKSVPTMIVLDDDGTEIRRSTGMMSSSEIRNFLKF